MKRLILILLIILNSCNSINKTQNKEHVNCNKSFIFSGAKNLTKLSNKNGDTIPFILSYKKDTCFKFKGIDFYKVELILKSKDYLSFDFGIGLKNDTIFTCTINSKNPIVDDIQPFISFKEVDYPRKFNSLVFFPRDLTIDSIYFKKSKKNLRINSFYNMSHSDKPKYTFEKFYVNNLRGIFQVDVRDNSTDLLYSTDNE